MSPWNGGKAAISSHSTKLVVFRDSQDGPENYWTPFRMLSPINCFVWWKLILILCHFTIDALLADSLSLSDLNIDIGRECSLLQSSTILISAGDQGLSYMWRPARQSCRCLQTKISEFDGNHVKTCFFPFSNQDIFTTRKGFLKFSNILWRKCSKRSFLGVWVLRKDFHQLPGDVQHLPKSPMTNQCSWQKTRIFRICSSIQWVFL